MESGIVRQEPLFKHRSIAFLKKPLIWSALSFGLGVGVWPAIQFVQGKSSLQLDRFATICDLQEREIASYSRIVELSEEYSKIAGKPGAYFDADSSRRVDQLNVQLRLLRNGFRAAEEYLAVLQQREPVVIDLEFRELDAPGPPGRVRFN